MLFLSYWDNAHTNTPTQGHSVKHLSHLSTPEFLNVTVQESLVATLLHLSYLHFAICANYTSRFALDDMHLSSKS